MTKNIALFIMVAGILFAGSPSHAQSPTIGLLHMEGDISNGYTLFTPERNESVYLIDNCGEKINEWLFSEEPGATCYLLENGTLLRAGKDSLEIRNWDNTLIWSYAMNINGLKQHHDIEPLPNGNILCVITDKYTNEEIIAEGRDPSIINTDFKLDKIVEIKPTGTHDAIIVWEWKFIDHLIQDFDSTKSNYGVVEDHPERVDLNFDNSEDFDYTHVNAIDYNTVLDQIIITARHLSELYIIDHSTTTAEAAGHTGGNSNLGGDFLWRWGNPQVYRQGESQDQLLFLPHDGKWVEPGYLDEGKVSVFNNDGDGINELSSVHLIEPEIIEGIYLKGNNAFLPLSFNWTWSGAILENDVYEDKKSAAHSLPNGNFIICETSLGQVSEVTKNKVHIWTYRNPSGNTTILDQFEEVLDSENSIFRAEKYPVDYEGFSGQDLTPLGIIENQNSLSDDCINSTGIKDSDTHSITFINPVMNDMIRFNKSISLNAITIRDISGRVVFNHGPFDGNTLDVNLKPAIYLLQLYSNEAVINQKIIIQ